MIQCIDNDMCSFDDSRSFLTYDETSINKTMISLENRILIDELDCTKVKSNDFDIDRLIRVHS